MTELLVDVNTEALEIKLRRLNEFADDVTRALTRMTAAAESAAKALAKFAQSEQLLTVEDDHNE